MSHWQLALPSSLDAPGEAPRNLRPVHSDKMELTVGQEQSPLSGVNIEAQLQAMSFATNGGYLVSGDKEKIGVWRVEDGEEMATMGAGYVLCLAVSKDGSWIAAGSAWGDVIVWNAKTYKKVFSLHDYVNGIDFSPDSTRLVVASGNCAATVWDVATQERAVGPLDHEDPVIAARYSPQGDRIATATCESVRVYDSNDGRLLVDIREANVTPRYNTGLLWSESNDQLFIVCDDKIKQIEASTGSTDSEWHVPDSNYFSCIVLAQHGEFIAYSTNSTVTFWDTSTHIQLALIERTLDIRSIALSPDDQFLAVGGNRGKITIKSLSHIAESNSLFRLHHTLQIAGQRFGDLDITIRQRLCEALYASGRIKEAGESLLEMANTFDEEVYMRKSTIEWVSDFIQRCLWAFEDQHDKPPTLHPTLQFSTHMPLLRAWARGMLVSSPWKDALHAADGFTVPRFMIYRAICERLETIDRILDASKCFHQMVSELVGETDTHDEQANWVLDFKLRCCARLENIGDVAADARRHDVAITHYSAALSLNPADTRDIIIKRCKARIAMDLWEDALDDANQVIAFDPSSPWSYEMAVTKWVEAKLMDGSWKDALLAAVDFTAPRLIIYRVLCERLEKTDRILDAVECFNQMANELAGKTDMHYKHASWFLNFKLRCCKTLERLGDAAVDAERHDEAIAQYSAVISLNPDSPRDLFIKRSKARMATRLWEDALQDANEAIALDVSSPCGYETKSAVLRGAGRYVDAIDTFETMLSKMAQSLDPKIREHRDHYISPSSVRSMIRKTVQRTIRHSPRVLIDTSTGRLHNKAEQAAAFESLPLFSELVLSMTTRVDRSRIKREVRQFFRYVMLSHKWEENEPLFQQVIHVAVYDLDNSPTHDKLRTFCKIVRDAGFNWAWSDTCCINKQDHFVLQEALVAMFKWYRGSAMMIVFLRGVHSPAKLGDLVRSIWNTRSWTFQEYVAAKVIHFYTEDWTPYLDLRILNHKESPEIMSEMEQATGVSAQQLMALRPGLNSIREKLRLASTRQTTLVEDAAYSLLGIFLVTGLPAIYGEGESALGRLLAHILPGSGDVSILAWNGQSSSYNSCLPARLAVYFRSATSHLPRPIEDVEMENIVTTLQASTLDINSALELYNRLNELPAPWFAGSRMKLPCMAFKLPSLLPHRSNSGRVYRVEAPAFGMVEIKTRHDLSRLKSLYLVHPWLDTLLDREDMQSGTFVEDDIVEPSSPNLDNEDLSEEEVEDDFAESSSLDVDDEDISGEEIDSVDDFSPLPEPEPSSRAAPMDPVPMDKATRALRLVARLRQPFGALLFTMTSTRERTMVYKRVAADSTSITVQMRENVRLDELLDSVRILDVL